MKTLSRLSAIAVALAGFWFLGAPVPAEAQLQSAQLFDSVGIDQKLNEQIPLNLEFRDEFGNPVRLQQYFNGKPVILTLVYYECPMLCTEILNGLDESMASLKYTVGKEFEVVTVSINPRESSLLAAEKKKHYVMLYGKQEAASGWHFLTGDEPSIRALAKAVGYRYMYDPTTDTYAHASGIMIATPQGKLARYMYGIQYDTRDLQFALMDASSGKIGSPVDKLLLLCYHYDPTTGKYDLVIANVFRIAGAVTIVGVGGFMLVMFRWEKRKRRREGEAKTEHEKA